MSTLQQRTRKLQKEAQQSGNINNSQNNAVANKLRQQMMLQQEQQQKAAEEQQRKAALKQQESNKQRNLYSNIPKQQDHVQQKSRQVESWETDSTDDEQTDRMFDQLNASNSVQYINQQDKVSEMERWCRGIASDRREDQQQQYLPQVEVSEQKLNGRSIEEYVGVMQLQEENRKQSQLQTNFSAVNQDASYIFESSSDSDELDILLNSKERNTQDKFRAGINQQDDRYSQGRLQDVENNTFNREFANLSTSYNLNEKVNNYNDGWQGVSHQQQQQNSTLGTRNGYNNQSQGCVYTEEDLFRYADEGRISVDSLNHLMKYVNRYQDRREFQQYGQHLQQQQEQEQFVSEQYDTQYDQYLQYQRNRSQQPQNPWQQNAQVQQQPPDAYLGYEQVAGTSQQTRFQEESEEDLSTILSARPVQREQEQLTRGSNRGDRNQRIPQYRQLLDQDREQIVDTYLTQLLETIKPTQEERDRMNRSISIVQEVLTLAQPGCSCHLYGSAGNDLWVHNNNDLDICIETLDKIHDKERQEEVVYQIEDVLNQYGGEFKDIEAIVRTKVPICRFVISQTNMEVDISVNNLLPVYNTGLLNTYCLLDPQIRDLIYVVKYWAKKRKLNDTRSNTLSSYAYALLVVFFMQQKRGVPCLQEDSDSQDEDYNGYNVSYNKNVSQLERRPSEQVSLGQLTLQFFRFYAQFLAQKSEQSVISVRIGEYLTKQYKGWDTDTQSRHHFSIEDPFEEEHDLGDVFTETTFKIFRSEIYRAIKIFFSQYHSLDQAFEERRWGRQQR